MKGSKNYLFYNVNGNHGTGDLNVQNFSKYLNTLKMFMMMCAGEASMTNIKWAWSEDGDNITCRIKVDPALVRAVKTYDSEAARSDFRNVRWTPGQNFTMDADGFVYTTKKPKGSFKGAFVEVDLVTQNGSYSLFTTPYVYDGTK